MPIRVECPQCHDVTHFADNDAGLVVACLTCGRHLRVVAPAPVKIAKVAPPPEMVPPEHRPLRLPETPAPVSAAPPASAKRPSGPATRPDVEVTGPAASPPRRPIRPAPGRGKWRAYLLILGVGAGCTLAYVFRPRRHPVDVADVTAPATTTVSSRPSAVSSPVKAKPAEGPPKIAAAPTQPPSSVVHPPASAAPAAPYTPPAAPVGFVGLERLDIAGPVDVDSYDGAAGAYVRGAARNASVLLSNGPILLTGAGEVRGAVRPGERNPLKAPKRVDVAGSTACLAGRLAAPPVKLDPFAHDSANATLPVDLLKNGNLIVTPGRKAVLPAGVYYVNDVVIDAGATLRCAGPVTLLVSGRVHVAGAVDTCDSRPAHCRVRVTGSQPVTIAHHNTLFLDCYAPQSPIEVTGKGDLFGSLVGRTLRITGDRPLHFDESLAAR